MASVSHQGPARRLSPSRDRGRRYRPIRCAGRGAPAGACHDPHRRVSLLAGASSCHHSSSPTSLPGSSQFGGEVFLKAIDGQLVLRVVARPRRDLGEKAERLQLADRVSSRRVSKSHRARSLAASARRRRPPGPGRPQQPPQCAAVIRSFEGAPGDFPSTRAQHPVANDLQPAADHASVLLPRRPRPTPADDGSGSRPWSSSRGAALRRCQNRSVSR